MSAALKVAAGRVAQAHKATDAVCKRRARVEAEIIATDEKIAGLREPTDDKLADQLAEVISRGVLHERDALEARIDAAGKADAARLAEIEQLTCIVEALRRRADVLVDQEFERYSQEQAALAACASVAFAALHARWDETAAPLVRLATVMHALETLAGTKLGGTLLREAGIPAADGTVIRMAQLAEAARGLTATATDALMRGEIPS